MEGDAVLLALSAEGRERLSVYLQLQPGVGGRPDPGGNTEGMSQLGRYQRTNSPTIKLKGEHNRSTGSKTHNGCYFLMREVNELWGQIHNHRLLI